MVAPAQLALDYEHVRFTGTASFDANGIPFRVMDPTAVQYVGPPNHAIDSAWEALIAGEL
jgi:hypothetical protein